MADVLLLGLNDAVWKHAGKEDLTGTPLALVRRAAGRTSDDLTPSEVDAFLRTYDPGRNGGISFRDRADFFLFARESIAGFAERHGLIPHTVRPLSASDLDAEDTTYLRDQQIPTQPGLFAKFIDDLRERHQPKIDEGLHDMIGDYFVAAQPDSLRMAYLSRIFEQIEMVSLGEWTPGRVKTLADRAVSDEMLRNFLAAVDADPDTRRNRLIDSQIGRLSVDTGMSRPQAARCLMEMVLEGYIRYIHPDNFRMADDSFRYAEHGLRTTSAIYLSAAHTEFLRLPETRKSFPEKIERVGIVGPGLEFVEILQGPGVPRQMYEPFVMMDALIDNGLADARRVEFDLIDINPEVIEHVEEARRRAGQGVGYTLAFSVSAFHARSQTVREHFMRFGRAIPGAVSGAVQRHPDGSMARSVWIPPETVLRMHPILGDMTADRFSPDHRYDLMMCFNTMVYLNQQERVLAGINIRRALRDGGVFWTDNRFETDSGERLENRMSVTPPDPLFDSSYLDLFVDESRWLFPATVTHRPSMKQVMELYRRP